MGKTARLKSNSHATRACDGAPYLQPLFISFAQWGRYCHCALLGNSPVQQQALIAVSLFRYVVRPQLRLLHATTLARSL